MKIQCGSFKKMCLQTFFQVLGKPMNVMSIYYAEKVSSRYEPKTAKNPWKSSELIHGKFTGFSKDFNGIFIGNLIRFFRACYTGKSMKNIKTAIKNPVIFQFSSPTRTLKFWANPWNTHENIMKILDCFSWPFNEWSFD